MQQGKETVRATVKQRAVGPDGKVHGTYNDDPYINTMTYDVEFPDGQVKEYTANVIAENIITQCDKEGFSRSLMEAIVDYRKDETAVPMEDKYVITKRGRKRFRTTTTGWCMLVQWRDGSEAWIKLKDMKEAHPVETAEFAKARGIDKEPAFAWWVPYTLRKRDVILASVKKRIRRTTHKYGVELPTSVQHAYELDRKNGGEPFWHKALEKEMFNVGIAFEMLEEGQQAPKGWSKVTGHIIWDVKMDFTRKAHWVLDGHKTPDPIASTYAGVVSRDSV